MQDNSETEPVASSVEVVEPTNLTPDTANEHLPTIHPQIDPSLSLPEHLQSIPFDEDLWRRMAGSKFRHPKQTDKALREDPDMRDILRASMAAASEREKEVLMHNQARVFSSLMYAVARSVGNFLNTPLAPTKWTDPPAQDNADKNDGKITGLKSLALFLLTPKVFLSVIALGFGVLAGYSQIQIRNLNLTIESYESALTSLNADKDALNNRLDGFNGILADKDREASGLTEELAASERENVKFTTEASGLNAKIAELEAQVDAMTEELAGARAGREASNQELQIQLDQERSNLADLRESSARLETELDQTKEALRVLEVAKNTISEKSDAQSLETVALKTEIARMETKQIDLENQVRLLTFAERALANIRGIANRWSLLNAKHVLEHVDRYDAQKTRQSGN
ncbi:hypothetical protein [uncultured Roseobacter sp.]|uniref:hypothetical protein n=1 Tax=uncultured Roseobacter sp. TaxID=114847 RepID=UPI002608C3BD|nr:hypothetical protein [uncultured Roseobacter sp.]